MSRELNLYIDDILDSVLKIEEYTKNLTEKTFLENNQVQDAVFRRLEIIGEAVKHFPENIRLNYSDIP
jgi:uncharacterized protein with HEPN domain